MDPDPIDPGLPDQDDNLGAEHRAHGRPLRGCLALHPRGPRPLEVRRRTSRSRVRVPPRAGVRHVGAVGRRRLETSTSGNDRSRKKRCRSSNRTETKI